MPNRTRQQMEEIVGRGASVMFASGHVATLASHLPSEAMLAKKSNDPKEVEAARQALLASKAALEAQLAILDPDAPQTQDADEAKRAKNEAAFKARAEQDALQKAELEALNKKRQDEANAVTEASFKAREAALNQREAEVAKAHAELKAKSDADAEAAAKKKAEEDAKKPQAK